MVQSMISMDDEEEDGCTIIVPRFHRHMGEWWKEVISQGEDKDGVVHSVGYTYKKVDEERFGRFKPVVCKRGDIRLTLPQIIHGSTGCPRKRQVIFPWLMGLEEDGRMELEECGSGSDVGQAHRGLEAMKMGPSGQGHRFSLGRGRFEGAVEIRGVTALGDALVGVQSWDSEAVLMERDTILGCNDEESWKLVEAGQVEM